MKKSLTALAVAAVSAPLAIGLTAAPAHASNCDNAYPANSEYVLRISPGYVKVAGPGAAVTLSTRLVRGNLECGPDERVGFWVRLRNKPSFYLARRTLTDSRGLVVREFRPSDEFRWYTDHLTTPTTRVTSVWGLVQFRTIHPDPVNLG